MSTGELPEIAGIAHHPSGAPAGAVVLTHGAGGNRDSPLLQRLCQEWARQGWLAIRFNMPFRRNRPNGPPSPATAAKDRAGIAEAIMTARTIADGPLVAGGHSYGGRQTSMLVAEQGGTGDPAIDVLTLFSYPLHPPGKPERMRTEHLPAIKVPTVFTHGTSDAFGSIDELRDAAALVAGAATIVEVTGARHDLASRTLDVPELSVRAALAALGTRR